MAVMNIFAFYMYIDRKTCLKNKRIDNIKSTNSKFCQKIILWNFSN